MLFLLVFSLFPSLDYMVLHPDLVWSVPIPGPLETIRPCLAKSFAPAAFCEDWSSPKNCAAILVEFRSSLAQSM